MLGEPSNSPNKFFIVAISRIKRSSPVVVRENVKRHRLGTELTCLRLSVLQKFLAKPVSSALLVDNDSLKMRTWRSAQQLISYRYDHDAHHSIWRIAVISYVAE